MSNDFCQKCVCFPSESVKPFSEEFGAQKSNEGVIKAVSIVNIVEYCLP